MTNSYVLLQVYLMTFHMLLLQALECATMMVTSLCNQNRRTLDLIAAKCFFYFMRAHEIAGRSVTHCAFYCSYFSPTFLLFTTLCRLADCRGTLHSCLRTATLR